MTATATPHPPRLLAAHIAAAGINPDRYLRWRLTHDGDPFEVRFPGFPRVLVTGHPDGAREMFTAAIDGYEAPRPNPIAPLVGDASLILVSGERHRQDRALIMPPFHGKRVRAYGEIIRESAISEMRDWKAGSTVDARAASRAITLRVILEAVFGVDSTSRRAEYSRTVTRFLESYSTTLMLVPPARRGVFGLGPWPRFTRARDDFDGLLSADIARRRTATDSTDRTDILGMLLAAQYDDGTAVTDSDLREQLRSLLVAGHETTATSVTWALFHLHRSPEVLGKAVDEVDDAGPGATAEQLAGLPYLDAVCHETLRLHPPVPIVLRRLTRPMTFRGVPLVAGDTISLAMPLLHTHSDVWADPMAFDPDRFVGHRYSPYEYAPFGGGHRRCVGFALAEYEMRIVIATVLARMRLELPKAARTGKPPISIPHNIATSPRRATEFRVVEPRVRDA